MTKRLNFILMLTFLAACDQGAGSANEVPPTEYFHLVGKLEPKKLNEASGIQAIAGGAFILHNDEGKTLFAIDATGRALGSAKVADAKNKDWEDITRVPREEGPLLVVGDIGDNHNSRKKVRLYFVPEPAAGAYGNALEITHRLNIRYPDGPRDAEAMAYDPSSRRILIMSKRDRPPRLYGVPLDQALSEKELEAEFLGEVPGFRQPTRSDILRSPHRGLWVSQPTGMDISADGRLAAVITYRSLYLFRRNDKESWAEAFQRPPEEYIGPPGSHDEAVGFSHDQKSIYVTTERRPAPLYRFDLQGDAVGLQ